MPQYSAPVKDMMFVFDEVLNGSELNEIATFEDMDADTAEAILDEAGKFCESVLLPINRSGDEEGCTIEGNAVSTPTGFKAAYSDFCEAGWGALAMAEDFGGMGLPKTLHMLVDEMINACNVSFSLYPGLTNGAYSAMLELASDSIKETYFPPMAEGRWSGTMCLTEAHCGTDLGLMRTRAEAEVNGLYTITGSKIFITAGEHDLTENIIHLVLARTPDAPAGIKGISLFLVPKFLVNDDGSLGERNPVFASALEHKMGIKASATCVMNFDGAKGYLIGDLHKGMQAMFKMMNTERLAVGMQGIGVAEMAYQNAFAYCQERVQGRAFGGAKQPDQPADPLTVHPDVRRMLLTMRAYAEGCRALAAYVGIQLDLATHHPNPDTQARGDDRVALLTPVVKAFCTDAGYEVANLGMQCMGGHGYIREWGMEQLARDVRITQLYEGTNGIQAMDLIGRKLHLHDGRLIQTYLDEIDAYLISDQNTPFASELHAALEHLKQATQWCQAAEQAEDPAAGAVEYLKLIGLVSIAYLFSRSAKVADKKRDAAPFYQTKLKTIRFFFVRILPQTTALLAQIQAGASSIMAFDDGEW